MRSKANIMQICKFENCEITLGEWDSLSLKKKEYGYVEGDNEITCCEGEEGSREAGC